MGISFGEKEIVVPCRRPCRGDRKMKKVCKFICYNVVCLMVSYAQGDEKKKIAYSADDFLNNSRESASAYDPKMFTFVERSQQEAKKLAVRDDSDIPALVQESQNQEKKFEARHHAEMDSFVKKSQEQAKKYQGSATETIKACRSCRVSQSGANRHSDGKQDKSLSHGKENQILIFVSSSMPKESLRNLFAEAQKVGGKLVFQGLIDNSFRKTQQYFMDLQIAADIDPTVFEDHQVSHIPVFLIENKATKQVDTIRGHISLQEALSKLKDRGELKEKAGKLYQQLVRK